MKTRHILNEADVIKAVECWIRDGMPEPGPGGPMILGTRIVVHPGFPDSRDPRESSEPAVTVEVEVA